MCFFRNLGRLSYSASVCARVSTTTSTQFLLRMLAGIRILSTVSRSVCLSRFLSRWSHFSSGCRIISGRSVGWITRGLCVLGLQYALYCRLVKKKGIHVRLRWYIFVIVSSALCTIISALSPLESSRRRAMIFPFGILLHTARSCVCRSPRG